MDHPWWSYWLTTYGVWAVLIGTFLEGESILVAGAIAAHHGYMDIRLVLLAALIGSFSGDQLYFFLGRIYGRKFLLNRPKWSTRVDKVHHLLDRYHTAFILGFRFLYGLRTVAPFVLGTSTISAKRFVPLNFLGALVWSATIGGMGYALGQISFTALITGENGERPLGVVIAVGLAVLLVGAVGLRRWRRADGAILNGVAHDRSHRSSKGSDNQAP
jgi:membrane protein DedA with SNARE-associated domain